MSRRSSTIKRHPIAPDAIYGKVEVSRFINFMMTRGKKSISQKIFYDALNLIKEKTQKEGIDVFYKALDEVKPPLEVRSRRVGGMTYQVPREVAPSRMLTLAFRWIISNAKERKEKGMPEKLAAEFIEASNGQGGAVRKRNDTKRMADSNRAFSHYRW